MTDVPLMTDAVPLVTDAVPHASIETAYAFFHQKERVYAFSTLGWQRDDIEVAIGDYVNQMNPTLYAMLARGRRDFLRTPALFGEELAEAVATLEKMLGI